MKQYLITYKTSTVHTKEQEFLAKNNPYLRIAFSNTLAIEVEDGLNSFEIVELIKKKDPGYVKLDKLRPIGGY